MRQIFLLGFVLFSAFLFGCADSSDNLTKTKIPSEDNFVSKAYFCQKDNCADVFLRYLDNANKSIHCSLYNIDLKYVKSKLAEKSSLIDVKIVFNGVNYKNQLSGSNVRLTKRTDHNKFCIIDGNIILSGSFNPTSSDNKSMNNIVAILSKYLAENYEAEFDEQWNNMKDSPTKNKEITLGGKKITNLFCPDDNCKKYVSDIMKNANESIYLIVYSFTDEDIADILLTTKVHVAGVFDDAQAKGRYSQYQRIKDFGLDVNTDNTKATLHHKVIIIDRKIVITGSMNPTSNGFSGNDENVLIIEDNETAMEFLKEFSRIYYTAR